MLENLFSSKIVFKILAFLFIEPAKDFTTLEIIKATDKRQANVSRELDKLVKYKIVHKNKEGVQNFYRLDQDSLDYLALEGFFKNISNFKKEYVIYNEEAGAALLYLQYILRGFGTDVAAKNDSILSITPNSFTTFKDNTVNFHFEKGQMDKLIPEAIKKLTTDTKFVFETISPVTLKAGQKALEIFSELKKNKYKISAKKALEIVEEFKDIVSIQSSYNTIGVLELKNHEYSIQAKNLLEKKSKKTDINPNSALEKFLAPEELTLTQEMRIDLLKLVIKSKQSQIKIFEELTEFTKNWQWLNFGYRGPGLEYNFFEETFNELSEKNISDLKNELTKLKKYSHNIIIEKKAFSKKLKLTFKEENFLRALANLSYLKIYRKDIAFLINFLTFKIIENFNKQQVSLKNHYYLTLEEIERMIRGESVPDKEILGKREEFCLYIGKNNSSSNILLEGTEAHKFYEKAKIIKDKELTVDNIHLLDGMTACLGETGNWVYGKVKIVNTPADIEKMEKGDILVSVATTPDILSAMKKAAAIVTDHGGITCHAAIVSRELNVPCLIGTKYATRVFKDGDGVVVCPRHSHIKFD